MRSTIITGLTVFALAAVTVSARAQQPTVTPPTIGPFVGEAAPDFSLHGATRYGLLQGPVRLSDFRGKTVVLAFFYQARTKG